MARPKNPQKLSPSDLLALDNAIYNTKLFPTMSEIQRDLGFSWETIKRRARELNNFGRIPDNHPFLSPSKQRRPKIIELDSKRRQILGEYLNNASKYGKKVSINKIAELLGCSKPKANQLVKSVLYSSKFGKRNLPLIWRNAGGALKKRKPLLRRPIV